MKPKRNPIRERWRLAAGLHKGVAGFVAAAILAPTTGLAACPAHNAFDFPDPQLQGPVRETASKALIYRGRLRVNTDGAPNSYHPMGRQAPDIKPINFVCNAIAVSLPDGRRLSSKTDPSCGFITKYYIPARDSDWTVSSAYTIDWFAIPAKPVQNGRYQPCIQGTGKFAGFFVSQTALSTGASSDICDPAYWVNSLTVPYITLPRGSADFADRGAGKGDFALVVATIGGVTRTVVAVVADVGNSRELGEGSVALHRMLRGQAVDPEWAADSYSLDLPRDVWTVLFPTKSADRPITSESLQGRRAELVEALGGEAVLRECLSP